MTNRIFQGGTSDWFLATSWSPIGIPSAGDTMTIATGDGTISQADVVNFGSLNDEQLLIGSEASASPAGFSADDATFGSGFAIASAAGGFATLNFAGTVAYAGSMDFATAGGLASLDIAPDAAGAGTLDLAGTVTVANGDSLAIAGGAVDLTGTVTVDDGALTLGSDTTLSGGGIINVGAGGTIVIDGTVASGVTINFEDATGTVIIADPLHFHGSITGFVTGDIIDLRNSPADDWSYNSADDDLTIYSGNSKATTLNPMVAQFPLTSSVPLSTQQIYVGSDGNGGSLVLLSTTRDWTGGSGDWYASSNWSTVGTLTPNSYPLFGDTAIIANGTATISAADFVSFGPLDDELVRLIGKDSGLVLVDGALGSDLRLDSRNDTSLVVEGTVTSDAVIHAMGLHSVLNLAIRSDGTVAGDLVNDEYGSIVVSTESALDLASGRLTNNGQIVVNGAATIESDGTVDGAGALEIGQNAEVTVSGAVGSGQQIDFSANSTLDLKSGARFDGTIEGFANSDTIDLQGTVANYASYDANTSQLVLRDGGSEGTIVASLNVAGNYGAHDFTVSSDGTGGTFITDTAKAPDRYLYNTLPGAAVVETGGSISLAQLLVESFGTSGLSIPDVQLESDSPADMGYFSYWDPNNPSLSYWTLNGTILAPDNLQTVSASEYSEVYYVAGNAIQANAVVLVPVALDDKGTAKAYVDYNIQTFDPNFAQSSLNSGDPTPQNVVNAATAFAAAYTGVPNTEDCFDIAHEVAAAAGATMVSNTGSTDPEKNVAGGFWRIAYAAPKDSSAVSDWSSLVQAGDILRIGWETGGPHSFTIVKPLDKDGYITVFDNGDSDGGDYSTIGIHKVKYWEYTNPEDITIFRLDSNDLNLVDQTTYDGKLVQDVSDAIVQGTTFNNLIIPYGMRSVITGGSGFNVIADTGAILNGSTISDFHAGDKIDLTDLNSTVASVTYDSSTGLLDVMSSGVTVADIQLRAGLVGTFRVSNDGGTAGLDGGTLGTLYSNLFTGQTPEGSMIVLTANDFVSSGDIVSGGVVGNGETLTVLNGGTAVSSVVSNGGFLQVASGGSAVRTTLLAGGFEVISSGATDLGAVVSNGGAVFDLPGGVASGDTVMSGGILVAAPGSIVSNIVNSGGVVVSTGVVFSQPNGLVSVTSSAADQALTVSDQLLVLSGGSAVSTTVSSGGSMSLFSGGSATSTAVLAGGVDIVFAGGLAIGTVVTSGASETVNSGGVTTGTVLQAGGAEVIANAGSAYEQAGSATVSVSASVLSATLTNGAALNTGAGQSVISGPLSGAATVNGGAGAMTVIGAGGAMSVGGGNGGNLDFVGGAGAATVGGAGFGATTLYGGNGSGASLMIGGRGSTLAIGASASAGYTALVAGQGNSTLRGGSGAQAQQYFTNPLGNTGTATILMNNGASSVIGGSGASTVKGGSGTDVFGFVKGHAGGKETIVNFKSTDNLAFGGYGYSIANLPNEAILNGSDVMTLSDGTSITFLGLNHKIF